MTRRNAKTIKSPSLYSLRRTSPSPVLARHSESLSQSGIADTLSKATAHAPPAAVIHAS
jgi:hypothetical protein